MSVFGSVISEVLELVNLFESVNLNKYYVEGKEHHFSSINSDSQPNNYITESR